MSRKKQCPLCSSKMVKVKPSARDRRRWRCVQCRTRISNRTMCADVHGIGRAQKRARRAIIRALERVQVKDAGESLDEYRCRVIAEQQAREEARRLG